MTDNHRVAWTGVVVCLTLASSMALGQGAVDVDTAAVDLAKQLLKLHDGDAPPKENKITIVLIRDPGSGTISDLGRDLAASIEHELIEDRRFTVVERRRIDELIADNKLSEIGLIKMEKGAREALGTLEGVQACVFGEYTDRGDTVLVVVKLISTETGLAITSGKAILQKNTEVKKLIEGNVHPVGGAAGPAPVAPQPAERPKEGEESKGSSFEDRKFGDPRKLASVKVEEAPANCLAYVTSESRPPDIARLLLVRGWRGSAPEAP